MMLVTPSVWIFFMLYEGEGKEEFNWKQLVGLFMLIAGTFWYIKADRDYGEQLALVTFIDSNDLKFKEGEEGQSLLQNVNESEADNIAITIEADEVKPVQNSSGLLGSRADYKYGGKANSGST